MSFHLYRWVLIKSGVMRLYVDGERCDNAAWSFSRYPVPVIHWSPEAV